jgi:hypothetical protein
MFGCWTIRDNQGQTQWLQHINAKVVLYFSNALGGMILDETNNRIMILQEVDRISP